MALSGKHLLITVEPWPPYFAFEDDNVKNPSGVAWEIFLMFVQQMNFTYTLVRSIDDTFGSYFGNGTVTGMVGMTYRKEVDFGLGPFTVTYPRSKVIEFSNPVSFDHNAIILPRPKVEKDIGNFLKPFPWKLWLSILACLGMVTGLGHTLNNSKQVLTMVKRRQGEGSRTFSFFRPLWIMRIFTSDIVSPLPVMTSAQLFIGTMFLAHLFISSAYSAVLTSLLTVPKVAIPVDSLEDLIDYGKIPWAASRGTAESIMFLDAINSTNLLFKTIGEKLLDVIDCPTGSNRVRDEGIAVICGYLTLKKVVNEEFSETGGCSFYIAKENIAPTINSMIFPKDSPLIPLFNRWVDVIRQTGIVEKLILDSTQNASTCLQKPGGELKNKFLVFGIKDLEGIFILLTVGLGLGFVALIMELIVSKGTKLLENLSS